MPRISTIYPMPGEEESQNEAILKAIDFVDTESPTHEALVHWMLEQGEMTSEDSATSSISFLIETDILSQNVEQMKVAGNGYSLLGADDKQQTLYTILEENVVGFSTLLELVREYDT